MIIQTHGELQGNLLTAGGMLTNASGDIDTTLGGYAYVQTTLSHIISKGIKQKLYTIEIADFIPILKSEGPSANEIIRNLEVLQGDPFEEGTINVGEQTGKLATATATITPIKMPVLTWASAFKYTYYELQQAIASSDWDLMEARLRSQKRIWDQGIQKTAFFGSSRNTAVTGLLNESEITVDSGTIANPISGMDADEFQDFVKTVLGVYAGNVNHTGVKPNVFAMPEDDYLGLGVAVSKAYPVGTKLDYLEGMFQRFGGAGFKILPLAYSQKEKNVAYGLDKNRYVLYNRDPETLSMSIPDDFKVRDTATADGINWVHPATGRYSGTLITRKSEVVYFDNA